MMFSFSASISSLIYPPQIVRVCLQAMQSVSSLEVYSRLFTHIEAGFSAKCLNTNSTNNTEKDNKPNKDNNTNSTNNTETKESVLNVLCANDFSHGKAEIQTEQLPEPPTIQEETIGQPLPIKQAIINFLRVLHDVLIFSIH